LIPNKLKNSKVLFLQSIFKFSFLETWKTLYIWTNPMDLIVYLREVISILLHSEQQPENDWWDSCFLISSYTNLINFKQLLLIIPKVWLKIMLYLPNSPSYLSSVKNLIIFNWKLKSCSSRADFGRWSFFLVSVAIFHIFTCCHPQKRAGKITS
jgi:hypothetical protein